MLMRNCDHDNAFRTHCVEQFVGKPVQEASAHFTALDRIALRKSHNPGCCGSNFDRQPVAQSGLYFIEIAPGVRQLVARCDGQNNPH